MIRVLHLAEGSIFAGIETHILALAKAFPETGVELTVASFADEQLAGRLRNLGIDCRVFKRRHKLDFSPAGQIAYLLGQEHMLLHTHGYLADFFGNMASRKAGKPMVATVHGHPEPFPGFSGAKMALYLALDKRALKKADRVIAVSSDLADGLESAGIRKNRIRVITNGLTESSSTAEEIQDFRRSVGADSKTVLFGFAGRFDPVKAPMRFVETAEIILEKHPDARFVLAGEGPLLEDCRKAAGKSGFAGSFQFLGFRNDIDTVIGACDFLLLPSDSEGVPQVLLAAMRDGTIPVCSDVGGVSSVLEDFPECLAPPDKNELAKKVLFLLDSPEKRGDLADRLRLRFSELFTAREMAGKVADIYREVIAK